MSFAPPLIRRMPRDAQEFVRFLSHHFRPVAAMCRERARFTSDDEIISFLRPFETDDKNFIPLIGRMRAAGVLVDLAGEWCPPPFLAAFIDELDLRHVLASPKVIQGWIVTLDEHVERLVRQTDPAGSDLGTVEEQENRDLIRDIIEVFRTIERTIHDNCARIAAEVAEYRRSEDAARLRNRLMRLIHLHDEYLEPVIQIVDISGEFFSATEKVDRCCARILAHRETGHPGLAEDARFLQREVFWLRRVIVRGAEEARRELAPLCEAAARESHIARGVNRALDAISSADWEFLQLEENLRILFEKDATAFSDLAIEQYMRDALAIQEIPPPSVPMLPPGSLPMPVTAADLVDKLQASDSISDLLEWVLDTCDEVELGDAVRLFHAILELEPERVAHTEFKNQYARRSLVVSATQWTWKGFDDGNSGNQSNGRPTTQKTRQRVPLA